MHVCVFIFVHMYVCFCICINMYVCVWKIQQIKIVRHFMLNPKQGLNNLYDVTRQDQQAIDLSRYKILNKTNISIS